MIYSPEYVIDVTVCQSVIFCFFFMKILLTCAGVVTLRQDYKICERDKPLTPEQAQILVRLIVPCFDNLF